MVSTKKDLNALFGAWKDLPDEELAEIGKAWDCWNKKHFENIAELKLAAE